MKKIIIVIGAPGSGKGTQAKKIAAKHGLGHISTGDLLRRLETLPEHTAEEALAFERMQNGQLVADALIYKLAFAEMEKFFSAGKGVVLDGAIRSVEQAIHYQDFFTKKGYTDDVVVIDIELSDDESFNRLASRRLCSKCGEIIPARYEGNNCFKCGSELMKRNDDDVATVHKRIESQGNSTLNPIRKWYKDHNMLAEINGTLGIEQVERAIEQVLQ